MRFFSEETKKYYRLIQTNTWPTLEISGIHMHRIKEIDPKEDTFLKVKSLGRVHGYVLDSCTGLGYTAITLARKEKVKRVYTVEKDIFVLRIAKSNVYSRELFENPKIFLIVADLVEEIKVFPSNFFNFILHDPPTIFVAGELYSRELYKEFFRVLKKSGKIFHYVGQPGIKRGKNFIKGVMERLRGVGFLRVRKVENAKGVIAVKL